MNQVSRPMQIALGAVLVFAILWFVVLRPKDPAAEPVAATPPTPAVTTPRANAGGASAQTGVGKIVETAKNGAASADAAVGKREKLTGDDAPSTPTTPAKPAVTAQPVSAPAATTPVKMTPRPAVTTPAAGAAKQAADEPAASPQQARADRITRSIERDLKARRAVVVLIWSKTGNEDRVLYKRVTKQINKRHGRVKVYTIAVGEVGRYDGLLSGLSIGQTPSTIVIAPNDQAKVLGGLVSVARIDRLTSSATLSAPAATTP